MSNLLKAIEREQQKIGESAKKFDEPIEEFNLTEDAIALSFCDSHPDLRYVARWGQWMQWTGQTWINDDTLAVYDSVRQHMRAIIGEKPSRATLAFTRAQTIAGIERLAKSDRRYAATVDQWDQDEWLLNTPAGIVDLRTGELLSHDPSYYITKITAVSIAEYANCPVWLKFLNDITGGDQEYIAYLQRVIGYGLTASTIEQLLFFLYGTGANGKGVFLNTTQGILNDYATIAPVETFTESKTDRHPADLAMLRGARVVIAQETEEGRAWAEAKIKALTGGDPITARFMRQDFFTFTPKFKLIIAGNHKPSLRNIDEAIKRRLHLLPFTRTFTGKNCDPELPQKLRSEWPAILRWMVDGCLAYQAHGIRCPQVVTDATAEYFQSENLFDQWLDTCCDRGPEFWESPSRLFGSWKRFAEHANERPGKQNSFGERLAVAGFRSGNDRSHGGRYWTGLRLKPAHDEQGETWPI